MQIARRVVFLDADSPTETNTIARAKRFGEALAALDFNIPSHSYIQLPLDKDDPVADCELASALDQERSQGSAIVTLAEQADAFLREKRITPDGRMDNPLDRDAAEQARYQTSAHHCLSSLQTGASFATSRVGLGAVARSEKLPRTSYERREQRSMQKWQKILQADNAAMQRNGFSGGVAGMLRAINAERAGILPDESTQLVMATPKFFVYINPPTLDMRSVGGEHGPAHVHVFLRKAAQVTGARCMLLQGKNGIRAVPQPYFQKMPPAPGMPPFQQRATHKHNMLPGELTEAIYEISAHGQDLWESWQKIFAPSPSLAKDLVIEPKGVQIVEAGYDGRMSCLLAGRGAERYPAAAQKIPASGRTA